MLKYAAWLSLYVCRRQRAECLSGGCDLYVRQHQVATDHKTLLCSDLRRYQTAINQPAARSQHSTPSYTLQHRKAPERNYGVLGSNKQR